MGEFFTQTMNAAVSFAWGTGTAVARALARDPKRLPARVVSIGNIQAGGAGKTPLVAFLARQAEAREIKVCILTRGYGSAWEKAGGVVEPGQEALDPSLCGDEIALLHDLVPNAWIGVGADRFEQFQQVLKKSGAAPGLVILDDGFQNRKLHKDVEIVAVTSAKSGDKIFRDFRSALCHADLIVWTKGTEKPESYEKPMIRAGFKIAGPSSTESKFLFVTGLADGKDARRVLEHIGYRIEKHLLFRDHARYAPEMVNAIVAEARALRLKVLLTGKDWVKWRAFVSDASNIEVVEPTVEFDEKEMLIWNRVLWGDVRA